MYLHISETTYQTSHFTSKQKISKLPQSMGPLTVLEYSSPNLPVHSSVYSAVNLFPMGFNSIVIFRVANDNSIVADVII